MTADYTCPREWLDELNQLRFERKARRVQEIAGGIWAAWSAGAVEDPLGVAAVCQVAFLSALEADDDDIARQAQLWRVRGYAAAVQTGELNAMAMLLIPFAFEARDRGDYETALAIMAEMAPLIDAFEEHERARPAGDWPTPGVRLHVLRRAQHEKSGYLLWRQGRYADALEAYRTARAFAAAGTRDEVRIDAGELLAILGRDELAGAAIDAVNASERFRDLADRSKAGGWLDVERPLRRNAEMLASRQAPTVQDLEPVEIE